MTPGLLETKFHMPPARDGGVVRERLMRLLDKGLAEGRGLTLISAPAGYGKTTLAAAWLASIAARTPAAWLSLDEADNDPARFMAYLVAAFQRLGAVPADGETTLPPSPPAVLDGLINNLSACGRGLVVALDDYHLIRNGTIHAGLEYLIEHLPRNVHLAITTREDPPLPLARLRARGRMTEIRARDLRFTVEEAGVFFNQSMGLELEAACIQTLESRTEGWAAGLQLAGLALQNLPDRRAFVEIFSGSHRYVLDYLAEEVLRQQPAPLRRFLEQTSILERMNAPACRALTGMDDSREILDRLDQANLFLIPLDNERGWYRYHHLFADYLRFGLDVEEHAGLCRKAAEWFEGQGLVFEAVRYALASRDMDYAAAAVERALQNQAAWAGGQVATLVGWFEALPESAVRKRPFLCLHASRIFYLCGRQEESDRLIDRAEAAAADLKEAEAGEKEKLFAYAALYRGGIASLRGEVARAVSQTEKALAGLPREDLMARARAAYSLGFARSLAGDHERSEAAFRQTFDLATEAGLPYLAVNVRGSMVQDLASCGRLGQACQLCRQTLELADADSFGPLGLIWSILGSLALERDDLEEAKKCLDKGIELSRKNGLQDDVLTGLAVRSRLLHALGQPEKAAVELEQARGIMEAYGIPRISMLAGAYTARLHLAGGKTAAAREWAGHYRRLKEKLHPEYLTDFEDLTLARVLLVEGDWPEALRLLEPLIDRASSNGRLGVLVEALILQARGLEGAGKPEDADGALQQAARLAAPEGAARVFIEEGESLRGLLARVSDEAPDFIARILARLDETRNPSSPAALPDPLSGQELRVLELIVAGKSNREIADELVISVGTAKWHVHHVLQKLGVGSRPQAIARARELGL